MRHKEKRVFLAIKISDGLGKEIELWQKKFKHLSVRWITKKNLHITLVPPWYEQDIEAVQKLLRNANAQINPFWVSFTKVRFGPNSRPPRLIWAEGKTPTQIVALKTSLEKVLGKIPQRKEYLLHLTLARFKQKDFYNFSQKTINEKVNWKQEVKFFSLMESHLSRQGAEYEIIENFPIKIPE